MHHQVLVADLVEEALKNHGIQGWQCTQSGVGGTEVVGHLHCGLGNDVVLIL